MSLGVTGGVVLGGASITQGMGGMSGRLNAIIELDQSISTVSPTKVKWWSHSRVWVRRTYAIL